MRRRFHPQLPRPPGVKSEGGGVPTTSTAGLFEVEALPRKRGAGAAWAGPRLEAWQWCQSRLVSAQRITVCVTSKSTVTNFTFIS